MQVGIITAEIGTGSGWQMLSANLIAALRDKGVALRVAAARGTPDADVAVLPPLAESRRGMLARLLAASPPVSRALRDCDLIHTLVEPFAPLGVQVARRRPHIQSIAGTYAALPEMRREPIGTLYRRAFERSLGVCISRYTQSVFLRAAPRARSTFIPLAVDAAGLVASAADLSPFPKSGPVVIFVGGVKQRKGALHLARSMASVRQAVPDATCAIIGSRTAEPEYAAQVQAEIVKHGLQDAVQLPGHLPWSEVLRWYKTADLLVVPSINAGWKFDGFGLIFLEAAAFGVPSIGTRECGAADAIDEDETGLLVSQDRVDEELPAAIIRGLSDSGLRRAMGRAAQEKAKRQTWGWVADQIIALYEIELRAR